MKLGAESRKTVIVAAVLGAVAILTIVYEFMPSSSTIASTGTSAGVTVGPSSILPHAAGRRGTGAGARDSAGAGRTEHVGEPGSCMSRLQRAQGRSDTDGSRHEVALSAAPSDDSHLSRFHAPNGSRRGEVEKVSVLLIFSRHSSRPERRLGIAKGAG